jgi:uncharacterized protein with PQ loop repeat
MRKRIHEKHEQYPNPDKWKRLLDKIMYAVGVIGPILTIPQAYDIWHNQSATNVSLIAFSSYLVMACMWLLYGITHKEKVIIFANISWIVVDLTVVLGIITFM